MFNKYLNYSASASLWKYSTIVPVFKSDNRDDKKLQADNYSSYISELCESFLADLTKIEFPKFTTEQQHGLVCGRSINTNLYTTRRSLRGSVVVGLTQSH